TPHRFATPINVLFALTVRCPQGRRVQEGHWLPYYHHRIVSQCRPIPASLLLGFVTAHFINFYTGRPTRTSSSYFSQQGSELLVEEQLSIPCAFGERGPIFIQNFVGLISNSDEPPPTYDRTITKRTLVPWLITQTARVFRRTPAERTSNKSAVLRMRPQSSDAGTKVRETKSDVSIKQVALSDVRKYEKQKVTY
ncbi:hypothetical protein BaRGS_00021589, partial [Batillaria attramentaria]